MAWTPGSLNSQCVLRSSASWRASAGAASVSSGSTTIPCADSSRTPSPSSQPSSTPSYAVTSPPRPSAFSAAARSASLVQ